MIGGDVHAGKAVRLGQLVRMLQQLAHAPLSPVFGKGINEACPGAQLLRRDFIPLGVGAERDQMISFCQEQQPAFFAQKSMEPMLYQQLMQILSRGPIRAPDLPEPVFRAAAGEILFNPHLLYHKYGITLYLTLFLYSAYPSSPLSSTFSSLRMRLAMMGR